ncbi:MAG: hypothetical protein ACI4PF_00760 [Christensenellales bacterium]
MQGYTEQRLRLNQLRMIVIIMVVIFAVILSYTIFWSIDYNNKYGFFTKTKAEVVSQVNENGITKDVLSYKVGEVEYRITADYSSNNSIGDTITIFYDKNNPIGIIYSLDNKRIILPVLSSLFGVVCLGLVIIYISIEKSYKNNLKEKTH